MSDAVQMHIQDDSEEGNLRDIELCKRVANVLLETYPGHIWHISANTEKNAGKIDIKLNYPDKLGLLPKYGYLLHINKLSQEKIIRAGGELLERYRLARGRATPYALADAIKNGCDLGGMVK